MRSCPNCGGELSSDALAGLCPRCLLAGVLEDDDHAERTSESAVADLSSGTTLGPFVIVELLGKGGMATVYHAYETELDRDVALKVLPPEFLHDHSFARRFEREARLVAKLEHPNIVPIYASGIDAGIPWMSMRLLAGGSLDTILKKERLSLARVVELLRGVAEGLDHAHAHGVIHRDVKPSNILLDDANHVCVGDFGLARVAERSLVHTQTAMVGTPHYMAPEQALGGEVDHRCDIYSLGIVVYEMLTGRVPFAADSPLAVVMKHVSEQIPIPPGQGPAEPLWRVVEQCLAKEPDGRWPSATAFAAAMEGAVTISALELDGVLVVSEQQSTTEPSRSSPAEIAEVPRVRPGRRRAVLGWTAAAGISLATLVGVTSYTGRQSAATAPPDAPVSLDAPAPSIPPLPTPAIPEPEAGEPSTATADATAVRARATDETTAPTATAQADIGSAAPPPEPLAIEPSSDIVPQSEEFEPATVSPIEIRPPLDNEVDGTGTATPEQPPPLGSSEPAPEVGDIRPELVKKVDPRYPQILQAGRIEGDVVLQVTVNPEGKVTDASVDRTAHRLFADPARDAVLQYEYTPGLRNGVPAEFEVAVTIRFTLEP